MRRETTPCTRRRALHGAAALLAGLAGCGGSTSGAGRSSAPEPGERVETDPESLTLRTSRDEPAAWIRPEGGRGNAAGTETTERPWAGRVQRGLIASPGVVERLSFADIDGVDDARAFVEETDFARETLLLDAKRIRECYTVDLCYISWTATGYHTYYARGYRDVDVACRTDARDGMAHLVRIPEALDPERVTGSGSGMTSGTCEAWERRRQARREEGTAGSSTGGGGTGADAASDGARGSR